MDRSPLVGIVILNWNNYSDTAVCLRTINNISYDNYFVVVVDNGSVDESGERLADDFEWCDFVFNQKNRGFAGGSNDGIDYALKNDADYVLLLNNDIEVTSGFLEPLVRTAERNDQVAGVGGVIYEDKVNDVWDAGGEMQPFFANHRKYKSIQSQEEYKVEFITCAMNLLSREFLTKHRLDEKFFFGVEEIDLSWQASKLGWSLYINPNCEVYHDVGSSTEDMYEGENLFSAFQKYHNTRGRLYHSSKNLRIYHTVFFYLVSILLYPFVYVWMGIMYNRPDILHAHLLSLYDYFLGSKIRKPSAFDDA